MRLNINQYFEKKNNAEFLDKIKTIEFEKKLFNYPKILKIKNVLKIKFLKWQRQRIFFVDISDLNIDISQLL